MNSPCFHDMSVLYVRNRRSLIRQMQRCSLFDTHNKHSDSVLSFARVISLSPAFSGARALSRSLSNTHTHSLTHTHTGGVAHTRLPRGEYETAGETICVCAQGNLWVTDRAELDFITFPQHVCFVCSKQTEPDSSDAMLRPL